MVNLTPQAISKAVRAVPQQITTVGEGRGKKIDLDGALTHTYINDRSENRVKAQQKSEVTKMVGSGPGKNSEKTQTQLALPITPTATNKLRDDRLKLQNQKLQIEVQEKLGVLISRDSVTTCFDKMSVVILNYFNPLSTKISPKISAIYEIVDQEKKAKVELLIQKEVSACLNAFSREIKEIIDTLEDSIELEAS